jgi:hypothetical protein
LKVVVWGHWVGIRDQGSGNECPRSDGPIVNRRSSISLRNRQSSIVNRQSSMT